MSYKHHKQFFSFAICALVLPQALFAYTQTINDIELKVSDLTTKPQEILISTTNPMTSANNSITAGQFLQKDIHPVRIKITNNSKNPIIVSSKSCLKQVKAYEAASKFYIDHFITPHLFAEACVIGVLTLGLIGVPGIAYWYGAKYYIKTTNENWTQAFNQTFGEKNKKSKCIIKPGSSVTKILLLKEEDESSQFTFQVFDEKNEQTVASFEVALED